MVTPRRGVRPAPRRDERARRGPHLRGRAVLVCAGALVLAWGSAALAAQYARTYALARQAAQLDQHRRDLIAENQTLRDEIQRLRTDDGYIEWLARKELGMVRPGEIEFLVVPPETAGSATGRSSTGGSQGSVPNAPLAGPPDRAATDSGAVTTPAPDPATAPPAQGVRGWLGRLMSRLSSLVARLRL